MTVSCCVTLKKPDQHCQFSGQALHEHENHYFCKFHLPLTSVKKNELNFDELESLVRNGHSDFSYVSLLNNKIDFSWSTKSKKCDFRYSTLVDVEIINANLNELNFFESTIIGNLALTRLNANKITFNTVNLNIPPLLLGDRRGLCLTNISCHQVIINNSHIRAGFYLHQSRFGEFKIENATFGWKIGENLLLNILKKIHLDATIHNLSVTKSAFYILLDIDSLDKINNLKFEHSYFYIAPALRGDKIPRGTFVITHKNKFDSELIFNAISTPPQDISEASRYMLHEKNRYQHLCLLAGKINDLEAETQFYILRNQCFEKTGINKFGYILSRIYYIFSQYGTNPLVSSIWILFFLIIFSLSYIAEPTPPKNLNWFLIGLSAITRPFSLLLIKTSFSIPVLKVIYFIQSLVAIPLWTLLIISLRWNFRRRTF